MSKQVFSNRPIEMFKIIGLFFLLVASIIGGFYADYAYKKAIVKDALQELKAEGK